MQSTAENPEQKNNTTEDSGVKYSLKQYSEHQIENWKNSKRIVIYNTKEQLEQFVLNSIKDKRMDKKMYFGTVSADLANRIKLDTGLDVEKYNLSLGSFEIRKILKHMELPRQKFQEDREL